MSDPAAGSDGTPVAETKEPWLTGCLLPLGCLALVVLECSGMLTGGLFEDQPSTVYGREPYTEPHWVAPGLILPNGTKLIEWWTDGKYLDSSSRGEYEVPLSAKLSVQKSAFFKGQRIPPVTKAGAKPVEEKPSDPEESEGPQLTEMMSEHLDTGGQFYSVRCGMRQGRFFVIVDFQER